MAAASVIYCAAAVHTRERGVGVAAISSDNRASVSTRLVPAIIRRE